MDIVVTSTCIIHFYPEPHHLHRYMPVCVCVFVCVAFDLILRRPQCFQVVELLLVFFVLTFQSSDDNIDLPWCEKPPKAAPVRKRRIFGRAFGLESDEDLDEDRNGSRSLPPRIQSNGGPVLESELLDGLPNWLDRLFEGSLPRYHVKEWPLNLRDAFDISRADK